MVDFWMNNVSILLHKDSMFEIIPTTSFDLNRKLNSVFRFSIYFSILSFAIYKKNSVFCFPFIVMFITIYIFKYSGGEKDDNSDNKIEESIQDKTDPSLILQNKNDNCIIPKQNNPFMNLSMFDISKNKKTGCLSYDNEGIKDKIDTIFDEGLYKDPTDIYSNNNSQNRFYTMPNTKPSNDQNKFGDWLYKTSTTCKEPGGGVQCAANLYNRSNDNGRWGSSEPARPIFVSGGDVNKVNLKGLNINETEDLDGGHLSKNYIKETEEQERRRKIDDLRRSSDGLNDKNSKEVLDFLLKTMAEGNNPYDNNMKDPCSDGFKINQSTGKCEKKK